MATSEVTREIAKFFREKLAGVQRNSTWFGEQIGRSQSHASQILRGNKPMSTEELRRASEAFGLSASEVMRAAESAAGVVHIHNPAPAPQQVTDPRSLLSKLLDEPDTDDELVRRLGEAALIPGVRGARLKRLQDEIRLIRRGELQRALDALPTTAEQRHAN